MVYIWGVISGTCFVRVWNSRGLYIYICVCVCVCVRYIIDRVGQASYIRVTE